MVCFIYLRNVSFSPTAVKKEIQRMSDAFKDLGSAFQMDSSPSMLLIFIILKPLYIKYIFFLRLTSNS